MKHSRFFWPAIVLGVLGLIVGYGSVVLTHDTLTARNSCPFHDAANHG